MRRRSMLYLAGLAALAALMHFATRQESGTTSAASVSSADLVRNFGSRASRSRLPEIDVRPPTTTSTAPPTTTTTIHTRHNPAPIKRPASPVIKTSVDGLPAGLVCIGDHEQGADGYATNTHNGYYGRYQYTHSTWNNYKGYSDANLAPPSIQDERALADYNLGYAHRHREWPKSSVICGV